MSKTFSYRKIYISQVVILNNDLPLALSSLSSNLRKGIILKMLFLNIGKVSFKFRG